MRRFHIGLKTVTDGALALVAATVLGGGAMIANGLGQHIAKGGCDESATRSLREGEFSLIEGQAVVARRHAQSALQLAPSCPAAHDLAAAVAAAARETAEGDDFESLRLDCLGHAYRARELGSRMQRTAVLLERCTQLE